MRKRGWGWTTPRSACCCWRSRWLELAAQYRLVGSLSASSAADELDAHRRACLCLALPLLAIAPDAMTLAATLLYFGAALGAVDVAMNAHAVQVERLTGRPMMSGFHGLFSVGGLSGALGMSVLLALGLPLLAAAALVALLLAVVV
ncbi:hypothetical protein [Rhodanobacter lindaniclasticus]